MSGDKRSVTTDALETLGSIIGPDEARDAIHLAVENVVAGEVLWPGQPIGLKDDGMAYFHGTASMRGKKHLGIVDPFLVNRVNAGEHFWLVVFPRQIKSLRHVWEHPDFPPSRDNLMLSSVTHGRDDLGTSGEDTVAKASVYLHRVARDTERTYEELIQLGKDNLDHDEFVTQHDSESWRDSFDHDRFWDAFKLVTGIDPGDRGGYIFNCSC